MRRFVQSLAALVASLLLLAFRVTWGWFGDPHPFLPPTDAPRTPTQLSERAAGQEAARAALGFGGADPLLAPSAPQKAKKPIKSEGLG
jgi:hypothetical protein